MMMAVGEDRRERMERLCHLMTLIECKIEAEQITAWVIFGSLAGGRNELLYCIVFLKVFDRAAAAGKPRSKAST